MSIFYSMESVRHVHSVQTCNELELERDSPTHYHVYLGLYYCDHLIR
jgi:hypothetical protein